MYIFICIVKQIASFPPLVCVVHSCLPWILITDPLIWIIGHGSLNLNHHCIWLFLIDQYELFSSMPNPDTILETTKVGTGTFLNWNWERMQDGYWYDFQRPCCGRTPVNIGWYNGQNTLWWPDKSSLEFPRNFYKLSSWGWAVLGRSKKTRSKLELPGPFEICEHEPCNVC